MKINTWAKSALISTKDDNLVTERLAEMRGRVLPDMIRALDDAFEKRANILKPHKKK